MLGWRAVAAKIFKDRTGVATGAGGEPLRVSVVVPTLNEEQSIAHVLAAASEADEIVVADGGSCDGTVVAARQAGARVIEAPCGRARQMNAGAAAACGEVLVFVHADTLLPSGFADEVRALLGDGGHGWGRFDVRFDRRGFLLDRIAWLISTRSRISRGATGDQAIFVRRDLFEDLGGYGDLPLFEDVEICRRLKRVAPMGIPSHPVVTSARRWQAGGAIRTSLRMWTLKGLYLLGVSPERLAAFYRNVR